MSVRLWLREAECWQCNTRVEISESQARELEQMKRSAADVSNREKSPAKSLLPEKREPRRPAPAAETPAPSPRRHRTLASPPSPPRIQISAPPVQPRRKKVRKRNKVVRDLWAWLDQAPPWLMSMLFHLALFLLLAMMTTDLRSDQSIVLSLAFSTERKPGDIVSLAPTLTPVFDAPLPKKTIPKKPSESNDTRETKELAQQLAETNFDRDFQPQSIQNIRQQLNQPFQVEKGLIARDIRMRQEILQREGGTSQSEAAVARALQWLAKHQRPDGSWRLDSTAYEPGRGTVSSNSAAAALALLPFLGAGQTHRSGIHKDVVSSGLQYLLRTQKRSGDLRGGTGGEAGVYTHGQATIVLCEAFAMTKDQKLKEPAQRAIEFLVDGQHSQGGWRYRPGMAGDTSVLGWQVMALQSAKMAGLQVSENVLQGADSYLESAGSLDGAVYSYMPDMEPSRNMTAEGLLCRMYLKQNPDDRSVRRGLRVLLRDYPPDRSDPDFYYWYYATQAFHHQGGPAWLEWNQRMRDLLIAMQVQQGRNAGSWDVHGYLAETGGRLYVTALAACTLEVYYRHLPLFNQTQ